MKTKILCVMREREKRDFICSRAQGVRKLPIFAQPMMIKPWRLFTGHIYESKWIALGLRRITRGAAARDTRGAAVRM